MPALSDGTPRDAYDLDSAVCETPPEHQLRGQCAVDDPVHVIYGEMLAYARYNLRPFKKLQCAMKKMLQVMPCIVKTKCEYFQFRGAYPIKRIPAATGCTNGGL